MHTCVDKFIDILVVLDLDIYFNNLFLHDVKFFVNKTYGMMRKKEKSPSP